MEKIYTVGKESLFSHSRMKKVNSPPFKKDTSLEKENHHQQQQNSKLTAVGMVMEAEETAGETGPLATLAALLAAGVIWLGRLRKGLRPSLSEGQCVP